MKKCLDSACLEIGHGLPDMVKKILTIKGQAGLLHTPKNEVFYFGLASLPAVAICLLGSFLSKSHSVHCQQNTNMITRNKGVIRENSTSSALKVLLIKSCRVPILGNRICDLGWFANIYSLSKCSNFSFFYVPKQNPNRICEKNRVPELSKQYPRNFGYVPMFFENILKVKNLCFLLHRNIFILVFFTT